MFYVCLMTAKSSYERIIIHQHGRLDESGLWRALEASAMLSPGVASSAIPSLRSSQSDVRSRLLSLASITHTSSKDAARCRAWLHKAVLHMELAAILDALATRPDLLAAFFNGLFD